MLKQIDKRQLIGLHACTYLMSIYLIYALLSLARNRTVTFFPLSFFSPQSMLNVDFQVSTFKIRQWAWQMLILEVAGLQKYQDSGRPYYLLVTFVCQSSFVSFLACMHTIFFAIILFSFNIWMNDWEFLACPKLRHLGMFGCLDEWFMLGRETGPYSKI